MSGIFKDKPEIVKGVPVEALRKRYVVETMRIEGITYLSRAVSCGKSGCSKCPHGPYWYACFKHKGRYREVYIGKRFMTLTEHNAKAAKGKVVNEIG